MMNNMGISGLFMIVVYAAVVVVPFYQLWKRTGHNGWLSLLMLIPLVNLIMLYVLAFKQWPALPDRNS
jgi:apolipoprotein N-acyltransferase